MFSFHFYRSNSGHGTYARDDNIRASVAGVMEKVNKLISIRPLKSRYVGEIGDVVVGRITEVQQKRWKVNTNSRLDSILFLASVNLPGGMSIRTDFHLCGKKYHIINSFYSIQVNCVAVPPKTNK